MRLNYSRTGFLALAGLLVGTSPGSSFDYQSEFKKQDTQSTNSIQEKVRQALGEDLDEEDGISALFALGDEAVPSLIRFLSDPEKGRRVSAARGLAFIGNLEGMRALRSAVTAEKDKEAKLAMSCFLAGGLVGANSRSDLEFLNHLAEGARFTSADDERSFPAVCAALALGMMGRIDSLPVLRKIAGADLIGSEEVGKAIRRMEGKTSFGPPKNGQFLSDEELIKNAILDGTFFGEAEGDKTSVTQITFNRDQNKAMVSLRISLSIRAARGYNLVLAKENGAWKVVGIWFAWIA